MAPSSTSARVMFVALCLCAIAGATAYVALRRTALASPSSGDGAARPAAGDLSVLGGRSGLLFSSAAFDATNGYVGLLADFGAAGERYDTRIRCERVHFATSVGICVSANRGVVTTFTAQTFGPDFAVRHSIPLQGVPSRARVSPDGRRGAVTVFVSGDSYNATSFSTRTTILEMSEGRVIADLEQFAVTRDGQPFKAIDFNFWGVTFANDGNRFFATLRTGGTNYLVEGDVDRRSARVLRTGVECPSLSPDNRRLVFKRRVSPSTWRLHVLDVASLVDAPLGETRSVDDQPEWLDNDSIAYMLPDPGAGRGRVDIWTLPLTGGQTPRLLVSEASSPAVLH